MIALLLSCFPLYYVCECECEREYWAILIRFLYYRMRILFVRMPCTVCACKSMSAVQVYVYILCVFVFVFACVAFVLFMSTKHFGYVQRSARYGDSWWSTFSCFGFVLYSPLVRSTVLSKPMSLSYASYTYKYIQRIGCYSNTAHKFAYTGFWMFCFMFIGFLVHSKS